MTILEEFDQPVFKVVTLAKAKEKQRQVEKEQLTAAAKKRNIDQGSSDSVNEFYNKCHGEDGKFCEGTDKEIRGDLRLFGRGKRKEPVPDSVPEKHFFEDISDFSDPDPSVMHNGKINFEIAKMDYDRFLRDNKDRYDTDKRLKQSYNNYLDNQATVINKQLRNGPNHDPRPEHILSPEEIDQTVAGLDTIMHVAGVVTRGKPVYRGFGPDFDQSLLVPGNIITDKGFLSTSTNPKTAHDYMRWTIGGDQRHGNGGSTGGVMKINTHWDTKAIPGPGHISTADHEIEELVLNRGTSLKINTVAQDIATRNFIVNAEVV